MNVLDLIDALRQEIVSVGMEMAGNFAAIANPGEQGTVAHAAYVDQMQRIEETVKLIGLGGLEHCCARIRAAIGCVAAGDAVDVTKWQPYFEGWLPLVDGYLHATTDTAACLALASHVAGGPMPMAEQEAADLAALLAQKPEMSLELAGSVGEARATVATDDDVTLELPPDLDPNLFDGFMQEAPEWAAELSMLVRKFSAGSFSPDELREAKRIAHTFKGSANIVGIKGIARIAHHLEDILEYLQEHSSPLPKPLADVLVDAAGCLEQMVFFLLGQDEPPEGAKSILQSVLDWANRIDQGELAIEANAEEDVRGIDDVLMERPVDVAVEVRANVAPISESIASAVTQPSAEQVLRIPVKTMDDIVRLSGEVSIKISQLQTSMRLAAQRAQQIQAQHLLLQKRILEIENLVEIRGFASMRGRQRATEGTDDSGEEGFDPLEMDQYNQLHSITRALAEEVTDSRELSTLLGEDIAGIAAVLLQQDRLQRDIQNKVTNTRMMTIKGVIPRLQRTVRQTCQATGKQAALTIEGDDALVDGQILAKLTEPLLHILRNAIDHGIEAPEDRIRLGKDPIGQIALNLSREGQTLVLRCADDGCGLDYAAIRAKGIARGLIDEHQQHTEAELARLILLPGFSTRQQISEISGRGVGLDVVRARVNAMKGSVDIHSAGSHRGMVITLRVQASLFSQHVLLVSAGGQMFGLPSHTIVTAIAPDEKDLRETDGQPRLHYRDRQHPVWSLAHLTGVGASRADVAAQGAVLVRTDDDVVALLVDRIADAREVFASDTGRWLQGITGLSGAAILGDGSVAPLLDIAEMLREPELLLADGEAGLAGMDDSAALPKVLVVDDSLSVRRTLTQLVEDAGYAVLAAKDGMEAARAVDTFRPDVVLTDMEMPNMNGLELTAYLRNRADTSEVPVIMITSRSQDKHRQQAERAGVNIYLTKPYAENALLDHIRLLVKDRFHAAASVLAA